MWPAKPWPRAEKFYKYSYYTRTIVDWNILVVFDAVHKKRNAFTLCWTSKPNTNPTKLAGNISSQQQPTYDMDCVAMMEDGQGKQNLHFGCKKFVTIQHTTELPAKISNAVYLPRQKSKTLPTRSYTLWVPAELKQMCRAGVHVWVHHEHDWNPKWNCIHHNLFQCHELR